MVTMWVLLWVNAVPGMGVDVFQLGNYGSLKRCSAIMETAKIMVTTDNAQVACVRIFLERIDNDS